MKSNTLAPELLDKMDAYWRAANYLSVGQIYLYDNPLLKRPLTLADVKDLVLGPLGRAPGAIHEGGELGYSLSHAFGAVFDNPDLVVACVVGDGEAETGPLATAWHSNKFLDPVTDGAVLPILHLNGYKIANPTLLARITREELELLLRGYGWTPYFVEGHEPGLMHEAMAATLDMAVEQIKNIQQNARANDRSEGNFARPRWPMIVLNSPKGWTGPKMVDGRQVEGTFRSHQVPLSDPATHPEHLTLLEEWLRSYGPEELFDEQGRLKPEL